MTAVADRVRPCRGCLDVMAAEKAPTNRWCVGPAASCRATPTWSPPAREPVGGPVCDACRDTAERYLRLEPTALLASSPTLLADLAGARFADNLADLRGRRLAHRLDLAWDVLRICAAAGHARPGQGALFDLEDAA